MQAASHKDYEIAVVEDGDTAGSALSAWQQLLDAANEAAAMRSSASRRLVAMRWTMGEDGEPARCAGERRTGLGVPRAIALPRALAVTRLPGRSSAAFAHWLCAHHEGGSTIAASNGAAADLGHCGLALERRQPDSILQRVEDSDGIIIAHGKSAWLLIALRMIKRVHGVGVMEDMARRFELCRRAMQRAGLYQFAPDFSHGDASVLRAQRWLHRNYATGSDLGGIGQAAGLLPRTLQRRFMKATGKTPIEYAQHVRISQAQQLILSGMQIGTIHGQVGYKDARAFRRIFHRLSGCVPSMYLHLRQRIGE